MEDMCLFNFFNFPLLRGTHNEGISHPFPFLIHSVL